MCGGDSDSLPVVRWQRLTHYLLFGGSDSLPVVRWREEKGKMSFVKRGGKSLNGPLPLSHLLLRSTALSTFPPPSAPRPTHILRLCGSAVAVARSAVRWNVCWGNINTEGNLCEWGAAQASQWLSPRPTLLSRPRGGMRDLHKAARPRPRRPRAPRRPRSHPRPPPPPRHPRRVLFPRHRAQDPGRARRRPCGR
jgi:hypothetical protein